MPKAECPRALHNVNAINVIAPYKYLGMWVFDDPKVGLVQEPFVAGADTLMDLWSVICQTLRRVFASHSRRTLSQEFTLQLIWRCAEMSGNTYHCEAMNADAGSAGSLKYFDSPPAEIFAKCGPLI